MPRGNVRISITADGSQVGREVSQVQGHLGRLDKTVAKTGSRLKSALKFGAASAGVAGLGAGVAAATRTFVDFDKSMRNVNSIAQLNEKRFQALSKRVLALAGPTAQAPKTLADGLYDLVSSGFDANESMKILEKSAVAASAGMTSTEVSTKAVAAVLNAYHLPAKRAGKVSDELFQTVNRGVISFEQLSSTIGDVLPFAASLGVGLDQVGASVATMTKAGIGPEETMTRIKNVMVSLLKPSEDLKTAFEELGVESGEQLIKQKGFQGALEAIVATTDGSKKAIAALFPNIRSLGGALALTGKNAKGAGKDLEGMKNTSGATAKAFEEQSKSVSLQWERTKARIQAAAATAGEWIVKAIIATDNWGKATKKWLINAWANVKRAFGDAMAAIFRGFAKLFDVASHLPGIGDKFGDLRDRANEAATKVDRLGEKIDDLPSKKQIRVQVDLLMKDFLSGDIPKLQKLPGNGPGPGDHLLNAIKGGAKKRGHQWALEHLDQIAPLMGAPGTAPGTLGMWEGIGHRMGLVTSSGYRPGDPGFHGQNRARDLAGAPGNMMRFARFMYSRFGTAINELIYTPLGVGIDNHIAGPLRSLYPASTLADHYDHVHVALQRGGGVGGSGTGDKVPALLEPGEFVMNRNATARMRPLLQALNRGIPRFQNGGMVKALHALHRVGATGEEEAILGAIAGAESGWAFKRGDGGNSVSPWQIHLPDWADDARRMGINLGTWGGAARMALWIKRNTSTGYGNWTMYRNGQYRNFLDDVEKYVSGGKDTTPAGKRKRGRFRRGDRHGVVTGPGVEEVRNAPGLPGVTAGGFIGELEAFHGPRQEAAFALAQYMTPDDKSDDLAAATSARDFWKTYLPIAMASGDPNAINTVLSQINSWQDSIDNLTATSDETNRLLQERNDIDREANEQRAKLIYLTETEGPNILAGVIAAVEGSIGGRVGIGFNVPGTPGVPAVYR